jgi:hypothetical protein
MPKDTENKEKLAKLLLKLQKKNGNINKPNN